MIRSGTASPAHAAKSWFQSSSASALSAKVSVSFAANAVPRKTIRQRIPAARRRSAKEEPMPSWSAKIRNDFSGGTSTPSSGVGGACHALRARMPIWPSPCGSINPGNEVVSLKPVSPSTVSHCERPSSGCAGRRSRSLKRHQPLVRPKTASAHN